MTRRSRRLLLAAAAAVLLAAAGAAAARGATLDDRVYAVASRLMCPVCAGQTVAESDSAVAREMRDVIRAKLEAGETPEAILKFFVGQFGESVLAEPPRRGLALVLYVGPAAGVVGGLALAVLLIRRWVPAPRGPGRSDRPGAGAARRDPGPGGAAQSRADLARLSRELETRERF
ncbi:MAG TPA: cytochrome c-type biogenesis protein CcmH [bacterium]|nr:cytochrome c-type biogenesis protein CcmH [bacterium]